VIFNEFHCKTELELCEKSPKLHKNQFIAKKGTHLTYCVFGQIIGETNIVYANFNSKNRNLLVLNKLSKP
jgi:hypothetical protein